MKLLDWIIGREPVATATGLAAVVTAGLGVAAVFGLDITAEQIAAIGALAAALAGWAGRRAVTPVTSPADRQVQRLFARQKIGEDTPADDGSIPLALIILIGLAVLLLLGLGVCTDALFHDEDEPDDLGHAPIVRISHERDCDDWNGGCGDQYSSGGDYGHNRRDDRNRNRGAFSPGPFDRSPVDFSNSCISLDCSGRDDGRRRRGDEPPPAEPMVTQSLFPPSFEGVKAFVLSTIKSSIELGRLFADTTITFVENLLFGIA
jgi:hypothetical protein